MVVEGVTKDVIKEIVDAMVVVFNSREPEFKEKIKSIVKGKRKVYRFDVTDIGLSCDVELTSDGEVVVHWDGLQGEEPDLRISSETVVFDGVMTQRVSPVTVMLKRKAKVKGSVMELNKFRPIIPELSVSYKKARAHVAEKYGLQGALKQLDEVKI